MKYTKSIKKTKTKKMNKKEMIKWAFIIYFVVFSFLGIIGTLTYYLP